MDNANLSLVPAAVPEFLYGRSLIYAIRRHSVGQSLPEASEAARKSVGKASLGDQR